MHNLVGHALENPQGELFAGRLQRKVMPDGFSVISDPTKEDWSFGSAFDNEGVKCQRITLINHGVLEQFLSTRTQQPQAYAPNGHACGNVNLPSARQSTLFVTAENLLELAPLLVTELKQQHLEYGLLVAAADVACDTSTELITIIPTLCYKIYVDGDDSQIVRGVQIAAAPQQWLDNLVAGGAPCEEVTILCHSKGDDLSLYCVAPELLFRRLPVRHAPKPKADRMIAHLSAIQTENDGDPSALFFQVAQDERDIDENLLKVGELNGPYYQDYLMTDAQIFTVEASEGSIFYSNEKKTRKLVPKVLIGNDLRNNENLYGKTKSLPSVYEMSTDDTYESFARDFRRATEAEYRKAVKDYAIKESVLQPFDNKSLRDRSDIIPTQVYGSRGQSVVLLTLNNLEHFACDASAELARHDFLENSGVNVYIMTGYHYFWGSDKVKYSQPVDIIGVQIYGAVKQPDGQMFTNAKTVFLPHTGALFNLQSIQQEMDNLLMHLEAMHKYGARMMETYVGPVLVEGDAVGQLLAKVLLEEHPNLLAHREPAIGKYGLDDELIPHFENHLDKMITSKNISVTANKSADEYGNATFCRHVRTDAEGTESQEMELIRNGELITLMGNRSVTKSTPYSNGFQQIAINQEAGFGTRGTSRLDFAFKTTVPHSKLKSQLLKEAKKQGLSYAYIIKRLYDNALQNIPSLSANKGTSVLQLYRVDVRTGKETPVSNGCMDYCNFFLLNQIIAVSKENSAYPVMMQVLGTKGSRDFPFAGVPTCIVAPDGILFKSVFME